MKRSIKIRPVLLLLPVMFFLVMACESQSSVPKNTVAKSVRIVMPKASGAIMKNIVSVFSRRIEERCAAKVFTEGKAELKVELVIIPEIGKEGFKIVDGKNGSIQIIGNDQRGVLYGVGKFLRTSSYSKDGFTAGKWRGTSVPEKPVRGMYFAVHFNNFYQNAPVEEVERYIEDLALWGINNLLVVPTANQPNSRTIRFLKTAKGLDMATGILIEANAPSTDTPSPVELRCDPSGGRGAIDPTYICPNKPGGMEYISKNFGDLFDWCRNLNIDNICLWPYDAGGCGCAECRPWGSNGYVKCCKAISKMAHEKLPGIKIILSTWFFDSIEWAGLSKVLSEDKSWVDMIMAEDIPPLYVTSTQPPLAGNLPKIGFPEISMYNTFPWGGFGATPLPNHLLEIWQPVKNSLSGGFPYSEGIFDDISKVIDAQLYWNSNTPLNEILAEYVAYEYSPEAVTDVRKVINTLEQNHHWRWWPGELDGVKLTMDWLPSKGVTPQADPGAEEAYATMKQVDARLPEWARNSWRWRILFIRTMLDAELKANGGSPNKACMEGFRELMKIYHVTKETDPAVKPPIPGVAE